MSNSHSRISAQFIAAPSPEKLQQLIFEYQQMRAAQLTIISIYQDKAGNHIAWFYDRFPESLLPKPSFKKV